MYTKKSLRDNSNKSEDNIDNFLSSDFNQSDFNKFIDSDLNREKKIKKTKNWWKDEEESSETSSVLLGTGKNFMKPKTKIPDKDEIPEIVVQHDIDSVSDSNVDLRLDLNKSSDQSQTVYNETIKQNESNKDNGFQHPMTFEGYTESGMNNRSEIAFYDNNSRTNGTKPIYGAETLKSNDSMLPVDVSNENLEMSMDFTKKEHLLSKVSLLDSFEDTRGNKSSIRYEDFVSTAKSDDHHDNQLDGTGYSYKTSINPASGDSFNTQGITNVTDTAIGDTTMADLAAMNRHYEHVANESFEPTPNSNIQMTETVKEVAFDKSYPPEELFSNNLESTMPTRSFGMKLINFDDLESDRAAPTPSPRKKSALSKSNETEVSHSEYGNTRVNHSRLSDNCEKKRSSRYSYVQSSGYGSKNVSTQNRDNGKKKEKSKIKTSSKSATSNFVQRSKHEDVPRARSNTRSRHNSANINKELASILGNQTYKIRRLPSEDYDTINGNDIIHTHHDHEFNQRPADPIGNEWHEKWLQERILVKKLQTDSMIQERDFKRQIESLGQQYERKISQLESQLARSRDQLSSLPDLANRVLGPNVTTEDIERIKKDIKAQESIISAYEKDNEKMREEMKVMKLKQKKDNNLDSFENERLFSQIASLKADLDTKEIELRNIRKMNRDHKIAGSAVNSEFYLDEIAQLKSELKHLNKKYLSSESERQKIEMKLDRISGELDKHTALYQQEMSVEKIEKEKLKETHKAEVDDLKRKIKWYLENQALLDRDSKKLKLKDGEISELKRQIDTSGSVKISSNIRAKERTVDIARIKLLEEENMSLKEDMYSLAKGKNIGNVAMKRTVQFLEEKIKSLEEDLEIGRNKENKSLRSLQQQFESNKHQYEETIRDLELDLAHMSDSRLETERSNRIIDLKEKIEQMTVEIQKKNVSINRLKVDMKKVKKDGLENKVKFDKNVRAIEPENRMEILKKELREKDIQIQRLQIQNDYLKSQDHNVNNKDFSRHMPNQLEYDAECAKLKSQLAHLNFELDNYKHAIGEIKQAALKNEHNIREECRAEIIRCEEYHKEQLKNVKIDYVGRHSESENATLQSQVEVQKNYITHLQSQISDFTVKARSQDAKVDELAEAKQQIQLLKSEMFDLRLIWSNKPGLEMIDRLRTKVIQLEEKENLKGRQLDEYVEKVVKNSTKPYLEEVERWRGIVNQKNQNLLQVQNELNHLLEALEELRRQGISIPKLSNKFKLLPTDNVKYL